MNITESIKFDKLKEENESLKNELAEKDKIIKVYIDITKNSDKVKTEKNELEYQLQQLKYEIKEKEQEIELMNEQCDGAIRKLLEQQLFKEDFKKMITTSYSSKGHTSIESWELKDNSKYDKLPSKEDKTCI